MTAASYNRRPLHTLLVSLLLVNVAVGFQPLVTRHGKRLQETSTGAQLAPFCRPRRNRNMQCFAKPRSKPPRRDSQQGEIPANLKRKVVAKRPALGHIVPLESRRRQKQLDTGGSNPSRLRAQGVDKSRDETRNNPSNLKILSGMCKGRRLQSPSVYLRPMMSKVKEAIFSTLTSFGVYDPSVACRHLDIFSGSGSIGLESLSRGATSCTFVDLSPECCDCIESNLELCKFKPEQGHVVIADALQALRSPETVGIPVGTTFQVVTMGPPYEEIVYAELLEATANSDLLTDDTIVIIEYPVELGCLPHVIPRKDAGALVGVRNRRYGRTVIAMYIVNPTGVLPVADSRPEEFVQV